MRKAPSAYAVGDVERVDEGLEVLVRFERLPVRERLAAGNLRRTVRSISTDLWACEYLHCGKRMTFPVL